MENWVKLERVGHIWMRWSHLGKWVTLRKMGRIWKSGSRLRTGSPLKMGDTKKLATLATLEKLRKVGHIRKSVSHLEKWATVGKMGHPWKIGSQNHAKPTIP